MVLQVVVELMVRQGLWVLLDLLDLLALLDHKVRQVRKVTEVITDHLDQ